MFVADPLHGPFAIPQRFERLLRAPEVQRLREVRLLNTTTPSLAGLSDVRRFTHTLAVTHLALRAAKRLEWRYSQQDLDALVVAAILHDVGSPAFAHLFEYLLNSKYNFTHEQMLKSIISGDYKRTNLFHQVYYGGQLALRDCIEELGIDSDVVLGLVLGAGQLGQLLAGTLDFDNIDNVYRMAFGLGLPNMGSDFSIELADSLDIDPASGLLTLSGPGPHLIEHWRSMRRRSYEIIAFDEQALASQAMLTDCLAQAVGRDLLAEDDWFLTDEQMLRRLIDLHSCVPLSLRETVLRFATSDYYSTIFIGWYCQAKGDYDLRLPKHRSAFTSDLEDQLGVPISVYVFYDKGTFEKRLTIRLSNALDQMSVLEVGEDSASTIVSVFTSQRHYRPTRRAIGRIHDVLARYGLRSNSLTSIPDNRAVYGASGDETLAF